MEPLGYCFPIYSKKNQPLGAAHLDLLNGMHDEGILKVFHSSLHPVVEGCSPLGVLQV